MMLGRWRQQVAIKLVCLGLLGVMGAGAEEMAARLAGRVTDQSGAPIGSAKVTVTFEGGRMQLFTTPQNGSFEALRDNPVATKLSLQVEREGFQTESRIVTLAELGDKSLEVVLGVATQSQFVTVTEGAGYRNLDTQSAMKTPTLLLNTPQSVSVIGAEQIRDQAMLSMADVVRYVPGITMAQGEGHRDAPVIRGNATTSDFFVNGVRDDVQYYRDLYNLERVEALKGPNAMVFGRGGGGGVLNRVTKEALFSPIREITVQGGSFWNKRVMADFDQPLKPWAAVRLNTMFEDSDTFRQHGDLRRWGVSPTLTLKAGQQTKIRIGYEYFRDGRLVDRGIPSFQGLPLQVDRRQYFGNPNASRSSADVNLGNVIVERQLGKWNLRNQTLFGAYDKYYGNVFPGAVNAAATTVALSAYDNGTNRNNFFNQTDFVRNVETWRLRHTLLMGVEVGRQLTYNIRNTGYFNNTATSIQVPLTQTTDFTPLTFRPSATDANNRVNNRVGATYMQDQIEVNRYVQIVAGLRLDHFDLNFLNNRSNDRLRRVDNMWSPRVGLVVKPLQNVSVYGNYSVSYLPSSGDQFSSLTATSQTLKPEKFANYEVGAKWDLNRGLSMAASYYWLDRTNTTAPDPNNPALIVQTGSQRSKGLEFSLNGRITKAWTIAGGYTNQDASITGRTSAALPGARVPMVPRNSVSVWNHYRILPRLSAGLGLIQQATMFAAIDNTVRIPSFGRADAALFYSLTERLRVQANVENLTNNEYVANGHNNNNLTPGASRTARISLTARF